MNEPMTDHFIFTLKAFSANASGTASNGAEVRANTGMYICVRTMPCVNILKLFRFLVYALLTLVDTVSETPPYSLDLCT